MSPLLVKVMVHVHITLVQELLQAIHRLIVIEPGEFVLTLLYLAQQQVDLIETLDLLILHFL